jgi:lipopolysaccharide export LptBFGC system permease protein LptF
MSKVKILHYDGGNEPEFLIFWNWTHVQENLGLDDEEVVELRDNGYLSNGDDYWVTEEVSVTDLTTDTKEEDFPEKEFESDDEDDED